MAWPYHFVNLSSEQISGRRKLLDLYGFYAWLSPIGLICLIYFSRILLAAISKRSSNVSPSDPPTFLRTYTRRLLWTLHSPLASDFGDVKVHLIGLLYTSWLLFLTTHNTGTDYMHFTKRLGHIAVSQLPLQYLLSVKSPLSPIEIATGLSHETLNQYHRLTGRIIHLFLLAHVVLYLNFFYAINALPRRLYDRDVRLGIGAFTLLTALAISASPSNRNRAYHKSFYVPHVLLSFLLVPVIYAHVPYTRRYVVQILILYLSNVVTRKLNTTTPSAPAIVTPVEGTNGALLHISIPIPKTAFGSPISTHSPGQHIYLKAGHNPIFPRSPFTIVSVPAVLDLSLKPSPPEKAYRGYPLPDLELVVRNLGGPITAWLAGTDIKTTTNDGRLDSDKDGAATGHANGSLLNGSANQPSRNPKKKPTPPARKLDVLVEGPYGSSSAIVTPLLSSFPNLDTQQNQEDAEEVLLIAGGVGATFTLPIYVSLLRSAVTGALKRADIGQAETARRQQQQQGREGLAAVITTLNSISQRVHFHWIVRSRGEAEWGIEYLRRAITGLKEEIETAVGREISRDHNGQEPEPESEELPGSSADGLEMNVKIYITRVTQPQADSKYEEDDIEEEVALDNNQDQEEGKANNTRTDGTTTIPPPRHSPPRLPAGVEIVTSTPNTTSTKPTNRPSLRTLIDSVLSPSSSSSSSNQPQQQEHSLPQASPTITNTTTNKKENKNEQKAKRKHNRITVLSCAPPLLTASLRQEVGRHVLRYGRDVRWFQEGFGWGA